MSALSLRASFHLHDCRNDQVRKNGLGSISIAPSFRDNLPFPGEDRLVVFAMAASVYSYFEKIVGKDVHATIPKGNMGYVQYTVPDTVAVEPTFVAFL